MNTMTRPSFRMLATLAAGTLLTIGLNTTALSAPPPPDEGARPMTPHDRMQHRQEWLQARLAKQAEHLQIQPAQQEAWQAYVNAVESPIGNIQAPQQKPTDAAGVARRRADFAAGYAAKMMNIASATEALQTVLTPEQQQKFDRMVMHEGRRGHAGWHRPHPAQHGPMHEGMHDTDAPPADMPAPSDQ